MLDQQHAAAPLSDHIYVLDFGELIFHGTPAQTRQSDVVKRAYLGDETVAEAS